MTDEATTALRGFRQHARRSPDAVQLIYFDTVLNAGEVDDLSDALAAAPERDGVGPGDRVAVFLQNMPHLVLTLLACWKLGAVLVPINPMLRGPELRHHLDDCGAVVLVALDGLWQQVAREVVPDTAVRRSLVVSGRSMQGRDDARVVTAVPIEPEPGVLDFDALLAEFAGARPSPHDPEPDGLAFLCYTSGTTGAPKGAMCSHRNVIAVTEATCAVTGIGAASRVLALAPLFHITGLMVQLIPALVAGCPLILSFRFHPGVMLDSIREHRPSFAVGPVTAYIGLLQDQTFRSANFASFDRVYSGGAPISPATARSFEERTGKQLLGAYGMTEATAATHLTPKGSRVPVDPGTGALAVGMPIPGVSVRIVDDEGREVPPGSAGEVVLAGPGVVGGYWNRPDATAATIRDGQLYSGDIGVTDEAGWLFLVDRKKDLINCSGFKVWPREVEDALYEHPGVLEAAVVGVPDPYRGETVKAYVSLRSPGSTEPAELAAFVRERLAAYKRPDAIEILGELPKTPSGKILRRALRSGAPHPLPGATLR
ncbi:AMP-binding protein [Nocardia sp. NPDC050799]|uniref:class I adenylate-forming enzyme family protein n=1 Tax=Nocardia sp. NPDC050799 TaxID=3154842 RepID=UPI0033D0C274